MNFAKKSLGQNFLIDLNIIKKIVNSVQIFNKDVVEIGPGKGALTDEILKKKPRSLILGSIINLKLQSTYLLTYTKLVGMYFKNAGLNNATRGIHGCKHRRGNQCDCGRQCNCGCT